MQCCSRLPVGARPSFWYFWLSRAVAASSAVPGMASPIALKNYAGRCGYEPLDCLGSYAKDLVQAASIEGSHVDFDFVEVKIASVQDQEERVYLNAIPTNFSLGEDQADRLIAAARQVLRDAPGFRRFVARNRPVGH